MSSISPDIFKLLEQTTNAFRELISSFNDEEINEIPFEASWTAAQVTDHVTQSNFGMAKQLNRNGILLPRDVDAGITGLKSVFLDFDKKLQSPEFILPKHTQYEREALMTGLNDSMDVLIQRAQTVDMDEVIQNPIFGEISKLELVHFVVFHTQRHTHQVQKIKKMIHQ